MKLRPLLVALTFDAEMDVFDRSFGAAACAPGWRGIEEGIPLINDVLRGYADSRGLRAKATWFVRSDEQIGALYGDEAYLLVRYKHRWQEQVATGDEIGFHPHLYRLSDGGCQQETESAALREQISRALSSVRRAGFYPVSSRIGEGFGSNAVVAALDDFKFLVDSTAMPGRVRRDAERQLDWSVTPTQPYHPSIADYRIAAPPTRRLLEVPMSMIETQAAYDSASMQRYVDLSFHHSVVRSGLSKHLREARLLVTVTHPSTVLPGIARQSHGLVSFNVDEFRRNLEFVFTECKQLQRGVRFITISECARLFLEGRLA